MISPCTALYFNQKHDHDDDDDDDDFCFLFDLILLSPINNLSVIKERVFLG